MLAIVSVVQVMGERLLNNVLIVGRRKICITGIEVRISYLGVSWCWNWCSKHGGGNVWVEV